MRFAVTVHALMVLSYPLGVISLGVLHFSCVALGLLGLLIVAVRRLAAGSKR